MSMEHDERCTCAPWERECSDPEAEVRAMLRERWPGVRWADVAVWAVIGGVVWWWVFR